MATTKSKQVNYFTELDQVDVTKHIEKKGKFSYLSWAYAVRELKKRHPSATWEVHEHNGLPYIHTECGFFVKVSVTVPVTATNTVIMTQVHPVLDHQNRTVEKPNAFQINTSIQRCLAKAIALHGLGIHLYAGEDLPPSPPLDEGQVETLLSTLKDNDKEDLIDSVRHQVSVGQINQCNFHKAMEHYTNTQ